MYSIISGILVIGNFSVIRFAVDRIMEIEYHMVFQGKHISYHFHNMSWHILDHDIILVRSEINMLGKGISKYVRDCLCYVLYCEYIVKILID